MRAVKPFDREKIFNGIYRGKRVLVTGHTGFKGSWLTLWLVQMGADVAGFSIDLPSKPCLFEALDLKKKIRHYQGDVRDIGALKKVFTLFKPEIVFHLAAQPIVRTAYQEPKETFDTNIGGMINMLECIRHAPSIRAAVMITSDKCYKNFGIKRGYREEDRMGGEDPYSASKACAELVCAAYYHSFFAHQERVSIVTARAGNVIGGGDWAKDRIVPDCARAWSQGKKVVIRKPKATRPWLHVLEPVGGYLWLGACLFDKDRKLSGEAFNFAPRHRASKSVAQLADLFVRSWGKAAWEHVLSDGKKEADLLQLSPRKTMERLSWASALTFAETVEFTACWYKEYYSRKMSMFELSCSQIEAYIKRAKARKLVWAEAMK